jgi:CsoR family transcriptional regulator, copper-sensing transcriptional repressor
MPTKTTSAKTTSGPGISKVETSRHHKAVEVGPQIKISNLKRLRRIEGQIRGLQKMVAEDRYCADILVQVSSVQEALRGVSQALLKNHLRHCATAAIKSNQREDNEAIYSELVELFAKFSR